MGRTAVVRVGATLRRPAHPRAAFVADLLEHLHRAGFDGAPRMLGTDEEGRQVLTWIEGEVPEHPPFRLTDDQLVAAARLVRGFHDAAASLPGLGGAETVAHGDLGPHNTVFRSGAPVAIIDWDEDVAPGSRLDDLAQGVWGFADLLEPTVPIDRQAHGLSLQCAAYGDVAPAEILDALSARFERARADHAAHGRPRAVAVFDDLLVRLDRSRVRLLAGDHDRASAPDG